MDSKQKTTALLQEIEKEFGNPEAQSPYFWNVREVIHIGYVSDRDGTAYGDHFGNHPRLGGRMDVFLGEDGNFHGRYKDAITGGNGIADYWRKWKPEAFKYTLDANQMMEDQEIDKLYWYAVGLHGRTKGWEKVNRPSYYLTLEQIQSSLDRIAQRLDEIAALDNGTIWSHPLRRAYAARSATMTRWLKTMERP